MDFDWIVSGRHSSSLECPSFGGASSAMITSCSKATPGTSTSEAIFRASIILLIQPIPILRTKNQPIQKTSRHYESNKTTGNKEKSRIITKNQAKRTL